MKIKTFIPLVAGLCIGAFALKIGLNALQKAKGSQGPTVQIWAASTDIPRGTRIAEGMLKPVNFPTKLAPHDAFTEKEKLIGRVPRIEAPQGLPVLEGMLSPPGAPTGVRVPPGLRAVAVKIDEGSGVDFHLEPGSHVDVVGYFQVQDSGKRETVARTLIENVEVAAVGARLSTVSDEGESRGNRPTRAVTLLVTPDKVPILHLAEQRGKIKLSMRNREDGQKIGPTGPVSDDELIHSVTAATAEEHGDQPVAASTESPSNQSSSWGWLFGRASAQEAPEPPAAAATVTATAPEPPAEPSWIVQVYRGDKLEVVRFRSRHSRERADGEPAQSQAQSAPQPAAAEKLSQPVHAAPNDVEPQVATHSSKDQAEDQEPQEPIE